MSTINYSEKIPNNVNLSEDRTLQRALEHWQPNFIDWWHDMGPEGCAGLRRLPAHRDQRRSAGLGAVRLREDARLPLGHLPEPGRAEPQDPLRRPHGREPRGRTCPASTAPTCAASSSRRATPSRRRSSSSATSGSPRRACTTCATCSRSTSRKAATCGRWSTCCTHFGRDGREEAEALLERRSGDAGQPAHPRRVQREDARLAALLHVHLLHRPRRQVPALRAGREQLRPAGAHDEVHADRGSAPHVRRRERRVARDPAHLPGDERAEDRRPGQAARRRRDRPADDPALPELPLQRDDRPVRRRPVEQRRHLLQLGPEGPLRGRQAQRRPRAEGRRPTTCSRCRTVSWSRRRCRCSTR